MEPTAIRNLLNDIILADLRQQGVPDHLDLDCGTIGHICGFNCAVSTNHLGYCNKTLAASIDALKVAIPAQKNSIERFYTTVAVQDERVEAKSWAVYAGSSSINSDAQFRVMDLSSRV